MKISTAPSRHAARAGLGEADGDEILQEIARTYNVHHSTISRLGI